MAFVDELLQKSKAANKTIVLCEGEDKRVVEAAAKIVQEGIEKGEIKKGDVRAISSEIYGLICSTLVYKKREQEMDIMKLYHEFKRKSSRLC